MRTSRQLTPIGAIASGMAAGLVGTVCMDTVRFRRQRRSGGERSFRRWEFARVRGWQDAPDPGQIAKRVIEGFTERTLPDGAAWPISTVMHWSYGVSWGALYGVVAASVRTPHFFYGVPFGAFVWLSAYTVLPASGLYEAIWKYEGKVLAEDLSGHLVYGVATSTVFLVLRFAAER